MDCLDKAVSSATRLLLFMIHLRPAGRSSPHGIPSGGWPHPASTDRLIHISTRVVESLIASSRSLCPVICGVGLGGSEGTRCGLKPDSCLRSDLALLTRF